MKSCPDSPLLPNTIFLRSLSCGIAAYGDTFLSSTTSHSIYFGTVLPLYQPFALFFGKYLDMMGLWVFIDYYSGRLLQKAVVADRQMQSIM